MAFPIALLIEGQEVPQVVISDANQTVPDMAPRQGGSCDCARIELLSDFLAHFNSHSQQSLSVLCEPRKKGR